MTSMENLEHGKDDKIIVFEAYDTALKANLIKTKLDAYGIPCFLSDENFNSLYPFQNELFPGVRLHIFEKDLDRVKEVLAEVTLFEPEEIHCPYCESKNIAAKSEAKDFIDELKDSVLTGLFLAPKNKYVCQDCGREFEEKSDESKSSTR